MYRLTYGCFARVHVLITPIACDSIRNSDFSRTRVLADTRKELPPAERGSYVPRKPAALISRMRFDCVHLLGMLRACSPRIEPTTIYILDKYV